MKKQVSFRISSLLQYSKCLGWIVLLILSSPDLHAQTVRDLNTIPPDIVDYLNAQGEALTQEAIESLVYEPRAGQYVDLTLVLLSNPYNSGLSELQPDGYPIRLHVFARDTSAASLGPEGMDIQLVDSDYFSTGLIDLNVGDVFRLEGVVDPFFTSMQITPYFTEYLGTYEELGFSDDILAPVVVTTDQVNQTFTSGRVQVRWENLPLMDNQFVRLENVSIEEREPLTYNPRQDFYVSSDDGETIVTFYDTGIRYRNDRNGLIDESFSPRTPEEGFFIPPPVGARLNIQGFLNYFVFADQLGRAIPSQSMLSISPYEDRGCEAPESGLRCDFEVLTPTITSFHLVDAVSNTSVRNFDPIQDGTALDINGLPEHVNIEAITAGPVDYVVFEYLGNSRHHTEISAPFALFGDVAGDFNNGQLSEGSIELKATPYWGGQAGTSKSLSFDVVPIDQSIGIDRIWAVRSETGADWFRLFDGNVLDFDGFPDPLAVRADVFGNVDRVEFSMEPQGHYQLEYQPPFAMFGDIAGNFFDGVFEKGPQVIKVIAYNASGVQSAPRILSIIISNPTTQNSLGKAALSTVPDKSTGEVPGAFELYAAYPNPFNPSTVIQFDVPQPATVRLAVYDLLGREVSVLVDGSMDAGIQTVTFDAGGLPNGTYLYRLETPQGSFVRQVVYLK